MLNDTDYQQLPEATEPTRRIFSQQDMEQWQRSEAYSKIEGFIQSLRRASAVGLETESSQAVEVITDFLKRAASWIDEVNATDSPSSRAKAFKSWISRVDEAADILNNDLVSSSHSIALPELSFHLLSSFGSPARMDYGTGHELSFLSYLLILRMVGVFSTQDEVALVKSCFTAYRELVGKLQKAFKLEAAGKMGVWGTDEHQHLVYHSGASQSRIHGSNRPSSPFPTPSSSSNRTTELFLSSLIRLNPDFDPSSTPDDGDGLMRLYRSEVLQRLPVVQHFRFASVLRWVDAMSGEPLPSTGDGLSKVEVEALDSTLDKRERDSGTVAPWSLPTLSGEQTPDELLSRLPSPVLPSPTRSTLRNGSAPSSPVLSPSSPKSASPLPRSFSTPRPLGKRRASTLSMAELADEEE